MGVAEVSLLRIYNICVQQPAGFRHFTEVCEVDSHVSRRFPPIHLKNRRETWESTSQTDRKSTRLNSSHQIISYAVFCLKKKKHLLRKHCRETFPRPCYAFPGASHFRPVVYSAVDVPRWCRTRAWLAARRCGSHTYSISM